MARHKKTLYIPEPDPQLDISSMVDVCFLLLIYFLVSTTLIPEEKVLALGVPARVSDGRHVPKIEAMSIRVDNMGAVFSGYGEDERLLDTDLRSRDLPILSGYLELYAAAARSAGERPFVQITVDNGTSQQRVVDVLNALAENQIRSVTFTDLIEM